MATTYGKLVTSANGQPLDSDLTTIAGLTATTDNIMQSASSAWASRTPTQVTATLDAFTSALKGLAPASGGGTTNFLRADGTWAAAGGVSDGDKGDVIVSGSGTVWALDYPAINAVVAPVWGNVTSKPAAVTALTGTNTGDQTSIVGITGTTAEFNAALTGADFATGGGTATGTNTGDQTITGTGDVTGSGTGSIAWTIAASAVTLPKMANVATSTFLGRTTAATGVVEALTVAQAKTLLAVVAADVTDSGAFGRTLVQTVTAAGARSALGVIRGTATATLSAAAYEAEVIITATGVTISDFVSVVLQSGSDQDENVSDMLDLATIAGTAGTDQITVKMAFHEPVSGPILLKWSAA